MPVWWGILLLAAPNEVSGEDARPASGRGRESSLMGKFVRFGKRAVATAAFSDRKSGTDHAK